MSIIEELWEAIDSEPGCETLCGSIRISRNGKVLFERAFGYANVQLGVLNQPNIRFHIASMTKMFISAAVVKLAVDGALSLEAHPSSYMPVLSAIDSCITLPSAVPHVGLGGLTSTFAVLHRAGQLFRQNLNHARGSESEKLIKYPTD